MLGVKANKQNAKQIKAHYSDLTNGDNSIERKKVKKPEEKVG